MSQESSGGFQTAVRQDVLLPKPELKKAEKHLTGKTDAREKIPPLSSIQSVGVGLGCLNLLWEVYVVPYMGALEGSHRCSLSGSQGGLTPEFTASFLGPHWPQARADPPDGWT